MSGRRDPRDGAGYQRLAEGDARTLAGVIAGMQPGSRGWHRLLERVADAGAEVKLVEALELTLRELKADIAGWI